MALYVAGAVGIPADRADWLTMRREDVHRARACLLPWIGRRATGRSSGDGRGPKRPTPSRSGAEPRPGLARPG